MVLSVAGDHLEENAAAIALEVFAVKLEKGVFARGQAGSGRHAGHRSKMNAANLALGKFGQQ